MTRIAFCAALYEAGRPYLTAFKAGIRAAARGYDACLVASVDDLVDPARALSDLNDDLPVLLTRDSAGGSPAAVRRAMLSRAAGSGADVLIFADMDDMLLAKATGNHLNALADADFSYGDLCLMDCAGNSLRRHFFDGADVPGSVTSVDTVLRRNFLGLSNTAVRAGSLPVSAMHVPDDIVAVDWWLFTTLLLARRRGVRTVAPVANYRLYDANVLGAGTPVSPEALRRSYGIMRRHYRAFRAASGMAARLSAVEESLDQLARVAPGMVTGLLAGLRGRPGVWYQGLDEFDFSAACVAATAGWKREVA